MENRQEKAPLFTAVKSYKQQKPAYFCIPGHRFARGIAPEWTEDVGAEIFGYDLTEAHGLDDLHAPKGAIREAQELAAELYGAQRSWFLVNGTTCGNEAMILAALRPGDKVLLPRNAHKSMLMGLILSGAVPVWMIPEYIPGLQLWGGIQPENVRKKLEEEQDIRAVVLVSPNYYGMLSDVQAIADICHQRRIPLLVDEAHGGHLYFSETLPEGALRCGADMCVQSWHKVTGSLTQSSVLHINSSLVEESRVDEALKMVQSTSPSYLLMTSLDLARRELYRNGHRNMSHLRETAANVRQRLNEIDGIYCPGKELERQYGIFALDESRLTMEVSGLALTAQEYSDRLFASYGVDLELAEGVTALAVLTPANTEDDIQRLLHGAREVASACIERKKHQKMQPEDVREDLSVLPQMILTPRDAWFAKKESVSWNRAVNCIAGEAIIPYPPGIPLVCPGERISPSLWRRIEELRKTHRHIHGIQDPTLCTIQVVKEQ